MVYSNMSLSHVIYLSNTVYGQCMVYSNMSLSHVLYFSNIVHGLQQHVAVSCNIS